MGHPFLLLSPSSLKYHRNSALPSLQMGTLKPQLPSRVQVVVGGGGRGDLLSILESLGRGSGSCSLYLKSVFA